MELYPSRVDWKVFLETFPKPAECTVLCETELSWDDFTVNMNAGEAYEKMRKKLLPETARALDKLLVAVCINGLSRKTGIDHSALYVPHCAFDEDDFQPGDQGFVIPRASPDQVVEVLTAAESIAPEALAEDIGRAWTRPKGSRFRNAKEFVAYVLNWIEVLREVRSEGGGLAIDLG